MVEVGRAGGATCAGRACAPLGARVVWLRWAGALASITSIGRLERASRGRGGRRAGCPGQALQTVHVAEEESEVVNWRAGRPACDCSRSTYRTETWDEGGAPGPLPAGPLACVFLRILTIICTHPRHPHRQRRISDEGEFPSRALHALPGVDITVGSRSLTAVSRPSATHTGRADRRERPSHSHLHYPVRMTLPSSYTARWQSCALHRPTAA